jgi:xanthine dehydrogenase small subunit
LIQFILNDIQINTDHPSGMTLLDFVRYERHLFGTKIGCREGDCGACTVLVGELINDNLEYRSATSCLMPIGNALNKHIVTIEGINFPELNPVQQAMSDEGATQCGFCTPGFVVSLAGFCLQNKYDNIISSIDGNICRCTGYKSIERAAEKLNLLIKNRGNADAVEFAVDSKIVPAYFSTIRKRLQTLLIKENGRGEIAHPTPAIFVGGGTDLYVQKHEEMVHSDSKYISVNRSRKSIRKEDNFCKMDGSVTVTDLMESSVIQNCFPDFLRYSKLVSSTQIRNMATIGGNFVNASPIGDFTVFFLALDAKIKLSNGIKDHELSLRNFYKGYKSLDKKPDEFIMEISFSLPDKNTQFNFEKVSKRTNLDIASVNSAIKISVKDNKIINADVSAGGVGPVPMYLKKTSEFLSGKNLSEENIDIACSIAGEEISPISDARGAATYKRFLLQQLIRGHFITLFPSIRPEKFESAYEEY